MNSGSDDVFDEDGFSANDNAEDESIESMLRAAEARLMARMSQEGQQLARDIAENSFVYDTPPQSSVDEMSFRTPSSRLTSPDLSRTSPVRSSRSSFRQRTLPRIEIISPSPPRIEIIPPSPERRTFTPDPVYTPRSLRFLRVPTEEEIEIAKAEAEAEAEAEAAAAEAEAEAAAEAEAEAEAAAAAAEAEAEAEAAAEVEAAAAAETSIPAEAFTEPSPPPIEPPPDFLPDALNELQTDAGRNVMSEILNLLDMAEESMRVLMTEVRNCGTRCEKMTENIFKSTMKSNYSKRETWRFIIKLHHELINAYDREFEYIRTSMEE